jgi:hypothetical protein
MSVAGDWRRLAVGRGGQNETAFAQVKLDCFKQRVNPIQSDHIYVRLTWINRGLA